MAGIFGSIGRALGRLNDAGADGLSTADKLAAFGASMRDDPTAFAAAQKMLTDKRQLAAKQQFGKRLGGLIGGSAPMQGDMLAGGDVGVVPAGQAQTRLNANSPELAQIVLEGRNAGYDMGDVLDVLKLQQPSVQYDRGFGYDAKTGQRTGGYHPELGQGETPLFDAQGNVVAVRNLDGSVQAAAERAGAIKGAEARAQAPYTFQTVQGPDGAPVVVSNQTAAALGSNGGVIARGQSPAAASAAKIQGDAAAQAAVELPGNLATAQSTLGVIQQLRNHEGRKFGTGGTGIVPAIPGTPTKDFVTLLEQARGKTFLEAFATLKGGGQITEREGQAAQNAIARLDRTQSEEGFLQALDELEGIVKSSMTRAQAKAGGPQGMAPPAPPAAQRSAGATYNTPRGPMKWTGTGWLPAN